MAAAYACRSIRSAFSRARADCRTWPRSVTSKRLVRGQEPRKVSPIGSQPFNTRTPRPQRIPRRVAGILWASRFSISVRSPKLLTSRPDEYARDFYEQFPHINDVADSDFPQRIRTGRNDAGERQHRSPYSRRGLWTD